ncbi:MAG: hypothetical protein HY000_15165 [Planctomycetes bacterium]|nr:hypothetical protein [Planctomycetota bacterium]
MEENRPALLSRIVGARDRGGDHDSLRCQAARTIAHHPTYQAQRKREALNDVPLIASAHGPASSLAWASRGAFLTAAPTDRWWGTP